MTTLVTDTTDTFTLDCGDWTVCECLVLVQAIYKYGQDPDQWSQIAKCLKTHPLLTRSHLYTPKQCQVQYQHVSKAFHSFIQTGSDMPIVVQLARYLHSTRIKQVEADLVKEEDRFRTLVQEIQDIQAGKWDDRLDSLPASDSLPPSPINNDDMDVDASREETKSLDESTSIAQDQQSVDESVKIEESQSMEDVAMEPEKESLPAEDDSEVEFRVSSRKKRTIPVESLPDSPVPSSRSMKAVKQAASPRRRATEKPVLQAAHDSGSESTRKRGRPKSSSISQPDPSVSAMSDAESVSTVYETKRRSSTATVASQSNVTEEERAKMFKKNAMMIWHKLVDHRCGPVFMYPVKKDLAPHYYDVIKKPMCLSTIRTKIREGDIKTAHEFHRDVLLLVTNAIMYNREDADMYSMAMEMKEFAQAEMRNLAYYGDGTSTHRRTSVSPVETVALDTELILQDTPDIQEKQQPRPTRQAIKKQDVKKRIKNK